MDEAGRGALAGPVVAAAVAFHAGRRVIGVRDSKQLSPKQRAPLERKIRSACVAWAVGLATVEEIDRLNVLQASLLAMRRAVLALPPKAGAGSGGRSVLARSALGVAAERGA